MVMKLFLITEDLEKDSAEMEILNEEISKLSMQLMLNEQEIEGESPLICLSVKCLSILVTTS